MMMLLSGIMRNCQGVSAERYMMGKSVNLHHRVRRQNLGIECALLTKEVSMDRMSRLDHL